MHRPQSMDILRVSPATHVLALNYEIHHQPKEVNPPEINFQANSLRSLALPFPELV